MPREKPLLIYDGDCNFCRRWVLRWQFLTDDRVEYAPYREAASEFPEIPEEKFQGSVQLVEEDGKITSGAEAVFRTLTYSRGRAWLFWMYQNIPFFKPVTEWFYALVARHRRVFSFLTRILWGRELGPSTFSFSSGLFLRMLGAIYGIAFLSLAVQILGLVGENGILPANVFLDSVAYRIGFVRFWFVPTIFWVNSSDLALQIVSWAGVVLSGALVIGFAQGPVLFLLWFLYLSLYSIGGDFLNFQWDVLLLETGFLAMFLAPSASWRKPFALARPCEPSGIIIWLFWWLLARLLFFSGMVKLLSPDPVWRNLEALKFYYEIQPLPTWIGWHLHHFPEWFHKFSALGVLGVELVVPFLVFAPKRARLAGCTLIILLQLLIMATGNYGFFNWLAIALAVLLIDDRAWPWNWRRVGAGLVPAQDRAPTRGAPTTSKWITVPLAGLILLISTVQFSSLLRVNVRWPFAVVAFYRYLEPFHLVNTYGLFATMISERLEIVVEGSRDGQTWHPYEFKFKSGDLKKRPGFVQPHQPRLDWLAWFAAISRYEANPWFNNFAIRLLQGSQDVLGLLKTNPFPDRPPRYLRALVYTYHMTDRKTLKEEGAWWRRELREAYAPTFSIENVPRRKENV